MNRLQTFNTVSARQIQRDYKKIFAQVNKTNESVVVISNNQPQVVIVSLKEAEKINNFLLEERFWQTVRSIQSKNLYNDPTATQKDIDEAVKDARQKVYNKYYSSPRQQRANKRSTLTSKRSGENNKPVGRKKIHNDYLPTDG